MDRLIGPTTAAALLAIAVLAPATAGCVHDDAGGAAGPSALYDGTDTVDAPAGVAKLEKPVVVGRARATTLRELGRRGRACARRFEPPAIPATAAVVHRVGVAAETLTLLHSARRTIVACEDAPRELEHHGDWCGGSSGHLFAGRLRDPRVELSNCQTSEGETIGFAWITPTSRTRWIAIEEHEYFELYEVVGGLPVRVSTSGVRVRDSRVVFDYRELAADGAQLARERMDAGVAG